MESFNIFRLGVLGWMAHGLYVEKQYKNILPGSKLTTFLGKSGGLQSSSTITHHYLDD